MIDNNIIKKLFSELRGQYLNRKKQGTNLYLKQKTSNNVAEPTTICLATLTEIQVIADSLNIPTDVWMPPSRLAYARNKLFRIGPLINSNNIYVGFSLLDVYYNNIDYFTNPYYDQEPLNEHTGLLMHIVPNADTLIIVGKLDFFRLSNLFDQGLNEYKNILALANHNRGYPIRLSRLLKNLMNVDKYIFSDKKGYNSWGRYLKSKGKEVQLITKYVKKYEKNLIS